MRIRACHRTMTLAAAGLTKQEGGFIWPSTPSHGLGAGSGGRRSLPGTGSKLPRVTTPGQGEPARDMKRGRRPERAYGAGRSRRDGARTRRGQGPAANGRPSQDRNAWEDACHSTGTERPDVAIQGRTGRDGQTRHFRRSSPDGNNACHHRTTQPGRERPERAGGEGQPGAWKVPRRSLAGRDGPAGVGGVMRLRGWVVRSAW